MRICKIWDSDYPWDVRVEKIAAALMERGHEVHLVARNTLQRPVYESLDGLHVHRLRPLMRPFHPLNQLSGFPAFFNPRWLRAIRRVCAETRSDLILVRDLPLTPSAIWIGRKLGLPVVMDMAENYPEMMRNVWRRRFSAKNLFVRNPWLASAVEKWSIPRLDHILVVVEESRDRILPMVGNPERITIVSNTPSLQRLSSLGPSSASRSRTSLKLVYLGIMEYSRGLEVPIQAMPEILSQVPDACLILIGDGREAPRYRSLVNTLGVSRAVKFLGRLPYEEGRRIVAEADIGLIPHRAWEGWNTTIPNKLFDYMSLGIPVVTSNARPVARIVTETGCGSVYTDPDPGSLAQAVLSLRDPAVRARCGGNGGAAVRDRYHWENDAQRLNQALLRTVEGRSASALARAQSLDSPLSSSEDDVNPRSMG